MKRGQPMRRGEPMQRTPMKQGPTARLSQSRAVYATMRDLVFERDLNSCIRCDGRADVTHHRSPRGMGGSSRDPSTHLPSSLVALCNADHVWVESWRAEATHLGYLVPAGINPADYPIMWHGQFVNLSDAGTVLFGATPPRLDLG